MYSIRGIYGQSTLTGCCVWEQHVTGLLFARLYSRNDAENGSNSFGSKYIPHLFPHWSARHSFSLSPRLTGCANENITLCLKMRPSQCRSVKKRCLRDRRQAPGEMENTMSPLTNSLLFSVSGLFAFIIHHQALLRSEYGHLRQTRTVGRLCCCSTATSWLVRMPASVTAVPPLHISGWVGLTSKMPSPPAPK